MTIRNAAGKHVYKVSCWPVATEKKCCSEILPVTGANQDLGGKWSANVNASGFSLSPSSNVTLTVVVDGLSPGILVLLQNNIKLPNVPAWYLLISALIMLIVIGSCSIKQLS